MEKSEPDAPVDYIQESLAANEARIQPLKDRLYTSERMKEKLIEETNPIFDRFILVLSKPAIEESKGDS